MVRKMWVCRSGKNGKFYDMFISTQRVYLPWDGYHFDLSMYKTMNDFRKVVVDERNPESRTSISNWAGQLKNFCVDMGINDFVLVPTKNSKYYTLCRITGNYEYDSSKTMPHSRAIVVLTSGIPRYIFPKSIQYSLGAFRTVFRVKQEELLLSIIQKANQTATTKNVEKRSCKDGRV